MSDIVLHRVRNNKFSKIKHSVEEIAILGALEVLANFDPLGSSSPSAIVRIQRNEDKKYITI